MKIGKANRLLNRNEPFPVMFWVLGIVQYTCAYTAKGDPAHWPGITQQWYRHGTIALLLYFLYGGRVE